MLDIGVYTTALYSNFILESELLIMDMVRTLYQEETENFAVTEFTLKNQAARKTRH